MRFAWQFAEKGRIERLALTDPTLSIGLVISSLQAGGAERAISLMASHWAGEGRCVTLWTLAGADVEPHYPLDPAVVVRPLGLLKKSNNPWQGLVSNMQRVRVLRRSFRAIVPDTIISFGEKTNVLTLLAAWGLGTPVIVSERTDPRKHDIGRIWKSLRWVSYGMAFRIVVQTKGSGDYFPGWLRPCLSVIPNPVVSPDFRRDPRGSTFGETRRVIGMGRLTHEKGFDILLRAFAMVAEYFPDWELVVWGEGENRADLERLRNRLGLMERASFAGMTHEPAKDMRGGDLFVLSSRYEGFPNVLGEAMACGLPVVAANCQSGPGDMIRDTVDGLLVEPEDAEALADGMIRLMKDERLRERLGRRATEIVKRFSVESVMAKWDALLRETVVADEH